MTDKAAERIAAALEQLVKIQGQQLVETVKLLELMTPKAPPQPEEEPNND